jgi:hypothetical protein
MPRLRGSSEGRPKLNVVGPMEVVVWRTKAVGSSPRRAPKCIFLILNVLLFGLGEGRGAREVCPREPNPSCQRWRPPPGPAAPIIARCCFGMGEAHGQVAKFVTFWFHWLSLHS